ncbi:MAG: imidazoleglycerol-phosphate dehydratase HisB [Planctomycetota bacterium]
MTDQRSASIQRKTSETDITLTLHLDGSGKADIATGLGFLDHMIHALTKHARLDLTLKCTGDLHIDDHHTVEDCAIALGRAFNDCLSDRVGIRRFGSAYAPLDESLSRVVIDLATRAHATVNLGLGRDAIGDVSAEMFDHFLTTLATEGRFTLHADVIRGTNDHHRVESCFKALALALREAVTPTGDTTAASTKGVL